ncbi:MAG TPA: RING finger protein [Planctomycetota bacterium]
MSTGLTLALVSLAALLAVLWGARRRTVFSPRRPERTIEANGRRAAIRLGGDFFPWGALGHMLKWRVRGRLAQIWYGRGDDQAPETVAKVDLRGASPGPITIRPRGLFAGARVGDPAFEAAYAVKAAGDLPKRAFGDGRIAAAMMRLPARHVSSVEVTGETLAVRISANLQEVDDLLALAENAGALAEAVLDTPPGGVEWLESSGAWRRGVCLVCGGVLASDVVSCASCRTPHHAECWRWIGECATYACRERVCR